MHNKIIKWLIREGDVIWMGLQDEDFLIYSFSYFYFGVMYVLYL